MNNKKIEQNKIVEYNSNLDIKPRELNALNGLVFAGTTVAIIGSIIAASVATIALPVTILAGLAALIASVLPLIWPEGPNEDNLFDAVMKDTEMIMNEKISEYVVNDARTRLESLYNILDYYRLSKDLWEKNKDNPLAIAELKERFSNAHSQFIEAMVYFKRANYEVLLLPAYANAANLHLLLLREGLLLNKVIGNFITEETHYKEFKDKRENYADHCVKWYNKGLEDAIQSENNSFYEINKYYTYMTLSVLDIIALFWAYDPFEYNKPSKLQTLTRKVYSNPVNLQPTTLDINLKEENLFKTLKGFKGFLGETDSYLTGFINYFENTDINNLPFEGELFGNATNNSVYEHFTGSQIYKVTIFMDLLNQKPTTIRQITFHGTNNKEWTINQIDISDIDKYHKEEVYLNLLSNDSSEKKVSHYLNKMILLPSESIFDPKSYLFQWIHNSISNLNHLSNKDENGKYIITQIPAIKASELNNSGGLDLSIVKGPCFTGGDVILSSVSKLDNNDLLYGGTIKIPLLTEFNNTSKFKIRIYYAANHKYNHDYIGALLTINSQHVANFKFKQTFLGEDYSNLSYNNYKFDYLDQTVTFPQNTSDATLNLQFFYDPKFLNDYKQIVIIDKIEFIPED